MLKRQKSSLMGVLSSRRFSVFYLMISWTLAALFGFASNHDCQSSWQLELLCDQALWLDHFKSRPLHFFYSLFSSPFVHNGIEHLLFVSVVGVLVVIQSFESKYGLRSTIFIFFLSHMMIGIFFALTFNHALELWPDSPFVNYGFERNWMGGSVGFFALMGGYPCFDRKKWFLVFIAMGFEMVNHWVLGTSLHISLIHTFCLVFGYINAKIYRSYLFRYKLDG